MITVKLFAGTDVGLRDNNEDNFTICPNLELDKWIVPADQQEAIPLGKRGCLVVVADGMGGMNAGEVASDIAIKTVQQMFAPAVLPADITEKPDAIKAYLKKVIIQADVQVKQHCKEDPETEGMGSTIVIAWLCGTTVYIAWLGDSRAYSYIPDKGISRLSKDHSYVQQLVDAKMLTEEQAMAHPQSNIITRSLGDTSQKAKPDVIAHSIQKDEIIMLCSDGLCGVCTDTEISDIIQMHQEDLQTCKETLTNMALEAGGSDNITIAFMQIHTADTQASAEYESLISRFQSFCNWRDILFCIGVLLLILSLSYAGCKTCTGNRNDIEIAPTDSVLADSTELSQDTHLNSTDEHSGENQQRGGSSTLQQFTKERHQQQQSGSSSSNPTDETDESEITSSTSSGPETITRINEETNE